MQRSRSVFNTKNSRTFLLRFLLYILAFWRCFNFILLQLRFSKSILTCHSPNLISATLTALFTLAAIQTDLVVNVWQHANFTQFLSVFDAQNARNFYLHFHITLFVHIIYTLITCIIFEFVIQSCCNCVQSFTLSESGRFAASPSDMFSILFMNGSREYCPDRCKQILSRFGISFYREYE